MALESGWSSDYLKPKSAFFQRRHTKLYFEGTFQNLKMYR